MSVVADAALPGDQLVLGELVLGLVQPADAQDQQLAVAERQGLLAEHVAGERRPALDQLGMMGEHLEDVENRPFIAFFSTASRSSAPWSKGRASGCAACAGSSLLLHGPSLPGALAFDWEGAASLPWPAAAAH
jgi:hypothetical protein